jgi:RNA polymerase sigma-B factor
MTQSLSHLELWVRFKQRDDRDAVVSEYRYLCRRAARRFLRPGLDLADLEQIAAIGLIKAVDRYDAAQTTPFEAYAWLLVLGELMHHVRDCERILRAPRRVRDLERRWLNAERELWTFLDREPREDDVASHLNATSNERREVREYRASGRVVSVELLPPSQQRPTTQGFDHLLDGMTLQTFFRALSPLERQIVRSIHLDGTTLVDLAKRLGYSRRHLTRLHRMAMVRLRNIGAQVAVASPCGH